MYDARLGRRWNLDPKPNFSLSQYSCFENNPIFFNDVDGDSVGVDKELASNFALSRGLERFLSTKKGYNFIKDYAAKGQIIELNGKKFEFTSDGKYHTKGIDLQYKLNNSDTDDGAQTEVPTVVNGRLKQNVEFFKVTFTTGKGSGSNQLDVSIAAAHESFMHVDLFTLDYLDNQKIDYSNVPAEIKRDRNVFPYHYHHEMVRKEYVRNPYSQKYRFLTETFVTIKSVSMAMGLNLSDAYIGKLIWKYDGGIDFEE
jgi:hypothetical protein